MRLLPKLSGAMLVVAVSVTAALSSIATRTQVDSMTAQYRSKGEAIALALAYSLSANTRQTLVKSVGAVRDLINESKGISGVRYIYIQDWEASILAHTFEQFPPEFTENNWISTSALQPGERVKVAESVRFQTPSGMIWAMDVAAPIAGGSLGVVHVGMDRASISEQVGTLRRVLVGAGLGIGAGGVLLGLLLAVYVFIRPIRHLTKVTSEIAAHGDLTLAIEVRSGDEIGDLARAFARLVEGLRTINADLRDSVRILGKSAGELSSSAKEQELIVSRHAAALQQAHATAQEIKQTSVAAAQKAEGVVQVARNAESITQSGQNAVEQTMAAMTEMRAQVAQVAQTIGVLSERAGQIGRITDTVKDLADQSNMLALNAAIEAVRSGEHGKGFAVVARQIRSLADESIEATRRVREALEDVSRAIRTAVAISKAGEEGMDRGLSQVKASGDNLRALSDIVKDSSTAAYQIAEVVNQQDAGIRQIFTAVSELSEAMGQTLKRMDETGAAAGAVEQVSEKVSKLVDRYRV
jgi:methyl-accepting chemotaxis protein